EARALRALLPPHGRLLLEIGAGAGRNTPRYAGFERVVVMDYSRTQLEQAQARLGKSERYIDAPAALSQVRAVLAPGATFILEFANKRNLKAILRWLLRRQAWNPFAPEPVEFIELNFDFHPRTMLG